MWPKRLWIICIIIVIIIIHPNRLLLFSYSYKQIWETFKTFSQYFNLDTNWPTELWISIIRHTSHISNDKNRSNVDSKLTKHDDVIKWKHFPRYWPFVRGIHRSPVNSPHKGQWRGALIFSLICVWINGWINNGEAGDLRRQLAHYDVIVMGHPTPRAILRTENN